MFEVPSHSQPLEFRFLPLNVCEGIVTAAPPNLHDIKFALLFPKHLLHVEFNRLPMAIPTGNIG